jgi:hypothetical protein
MILKEWKCPKHGSFEGSHPICPASGCDSEGVEREYLTPPGFKSDTTKLTDSGFRRTAEVYGLSDMNNKDGQAVANGQNSSQAIWGADKLPNYDRMLSDAKTPMTVNGKTDNNRGMQLASEGTGTFGGRVLPAGEVTVHKADKRAYQALKNR